MVNCMKVQNVINPDQLWVKLVFVCYFSIIKLVTGQVGSGCMEKRCLYINDHLKLGTIVNPPFLYECAINNSSKCDQQGIEMELLLQLSTMLNFTFDLVDAHPPDYSNLSSAEILVEDLESGAVNMSASLIIIKPNNKSLSFSQPIFYQRKAFLMRTPKVSKIEFLLTLPFSPMVWLCFLTMVVSYFIALTVIATVFKDAGKYSHISHNAWTILSSLVKPVPSHRYKQHAAVRTLMISWQLGKMVILSLYSASLVGFIFISGDPSIPFNSTQQMLNLVKQGRLRVAVIKDLQFLISWTRNTTLQDDVLDSLSINPPVLFNTSLQAVNYVASTPNVVLAGFDTTLEIWVRMYNVCGVSVITDYTEGFNFMGYTFHKDFPYSEQIQRTTSQLAGSYYMKKLYEKYVGLTNDCTHKSKRAEERKRSLMALGIAQLQGTFWVLAFGAIIGTFGVIGELALYARAQRKLKQRHATNVESLF